MKIKKYLWMLPFMATLLILWPLYGSDILRIYTIGNPDKGVMTYRWDDTLGKTGNLYFDGSGTNDASLNTGTDYAGTADSTILVEIFSANYSQNDTAASDFDGSGLDDITIRGTYAGTADSFWVLEIFKAHYTQNDTAAIAFDGSGLDSAVVTGTYVGTEDSIIVVEIRDTSHANGDTVYIGAIDGVDTTGVSWYDTTVLAGAAIDLGATGLSITFEVDTGHTIGERWVFTGYGYWNDSAKVATDAGLDTTGLTLGTAFELSGDSVQIGTGIYAVWADSTGHTIGDRTAFFGHGYWADSIRFGIDTAQDTASWSTWDDTIAIDADSNALDVGICYIIFDSLAGHTVGDRWQIDLHSFGEGRDTVNNDPAIGKPRIVIASDKSYILFHTELYASKAAINDTIIVQYQNSKCADTFFTTLKADTVVGATLADTLDAGFALDTGTFRYKYWRTIILLAGEEPDTTNYNFYGEVILY